MNRVIFADTDIQSGEGNRDNIQVPNGQRRNIGGQYQAHYYDGYGDQHQSYRPISGYQSQRKVVLGEMRLSDLEIKIN